jgi:AcrR family transcriptional regulator
MVTKNQRLTREEWLARALDVVAKRGYTKLRIYELVKQIGVTTGSFYWHFKGRDDFVRRLYDYYHRISTDQIIANAERVGGDAAQRLHALMRIVAESDIGRYEIAMLSWAIQEPQLEAAFRDSIGQRVIFATGLFRELGFSGDELDFRARAFVAYMRAVFESDDPKVKSDHLRHLDERLAFFARK